MQASNLLGRLFSVLATFNFVTNPSLSDFKKTLGFLVIAKLRVSKLMPVREVYKLGNSEVASDNRSDFG